MAASRPLLAGLALLFMVGPAWAQERLEITVEVDLVPRPESGAFNLFLLGTDQVDGQGEPIWSRSPDEIQRMGLWLQRWPVHQVLALQSGRHYRAVIGTQDHPQPFDPASDDLLFEDQPGPLRFALSAVAPTLPKAKLEPGEAWVQLRLELGSLRSEGAVLRLMGFDADALRDGGLRRDAMPLEIIELKGDINGSSLSQKLPLILGRIYVPSLSQANAGLLSDILGTPVEYAGGDELTLHFGASKTEAVRSPVPSSPGAVAVTRIERPTEQSGAMPAAIATLVGGLSLIAIFGTLWARRKP